MRLRENGGASRSRIPDRGVAQQWAARSPGVIGASL